MHFQSQSLRGRISQSVLLLGAALGVTLTSGCATTQIADGAKVAVAQKEEAMNLSNAVVEVVVFKLKPGVAPEAFQEAATKVNALVSARQGFLKRQLLNGAEQGQYVDVVHWACMEDAMSAAEAIMATESGGAFVSMIDENSMQMMHLQDVPLTVTGN